MGGQLVPFPVVVTGIDHPILGAAGQIAAWPGRRPSVVVGAQLDAATIGIEQYLLGIEAGAAVRAPWALNPIGVALTDRQPFNMDMPVVGGAVETGRERDHLWRAVLGAGEEQ